jgi:hypothetical protein
LTELSFSLASKQIFIFNALKRHREIKDIEREREREKEKERERVIYRET